MIRQETIYDKTTYKIIDYKEYFNGNLIVHNQTIPNGNTTYKTFYDGIEVYSEYDKLDRPIIETFPLDNFDIRYSNETRIPYKNLPKQYIEAYYEIRYTSIFDRSGNIHKSYHPMNLILFKKLNDTYKLRITKYLDKK